MTTKRNAPSSPARSNSSDSEESVSSDSEESVDNEDDHSDSESSNSDRSRESVWSVDNLNEIWWNRYRTSGSFLDAFRSLDFLYRYPDRYPKPDILNGFDYDIEHDGDRSVIRQLSSDWGYPSHWWIEQKMLDHGIIVVSRQDEEGRILGFRPPKEIESLPAYIDRLQALQNLDLSLSSQLRNLPKEIGNFNHLIRLNLCDSLIESLPPSIGKLQNLKLLRLWHTKQLTCLPEEIGDLGSLVNLDLGFSGITSLPPSIGRLQSLQELDLRETEQLTSLPEEIGNLGSLILLELSGSGVTTLPPSIEYALACSRFRSRAAMASPNLKTLRWPIVFENAKLATHVFRPYDEITQEDFFDFFEPEYLTTIDEREKRLKGLEPHDAMYRFLVDYRESFLDVLIDRNKNSTVSNRSNNSNNN